MAAQSIRQWLRTSAGGEQLRLHFSNRYGDRPVVMTSVFVAKSHATKEIDPHLQQAVTFSGLTTVIMNPGEEIVSDAIPMAVTPLQKLAVSFYLPAGASITSVHSTPMQNAMLSEEGNITQKERWHHKQFDETRYFISKLEVLTSNRSKLIVALGDSITDGVGIEIDQYHRWPDFLAERLQGDASMRHLAVINAGIAGNRLLNGATAPFVGNSGLSRFGEDALGHPHLQAVLLFLGTNDILANGLLPQAEEQVTASQLIAGYERLIKQTHMAGGKIFGATLIPRSGSKGMLAHSDGAELLRQQINNWIRTSKSFDAVLDFDLILRDPESPNHLAPQFDSGDHTHPNAKGYRAITNAVDLALFK